MAARPYSFSGDPLSDLLSSIQLSGALFFQVDASDPWCIDIPHSDVYRAELMPATRRVISYHVVVAGHGIATVTGDPPIPFETGDILVFPRGDGYRMESAPGVPPEFDRAATIAFFRDMAAGRLPYIVEEGGGGEPHARFVCGFLGCDPLSFNPLFAQLPRLLVIRRIRDGDDTLAKLVDITLAEFRVDRWGGSRLRSGLSELIFVEAVRRYLAQESGERRGWLGALADPVVGAALRAIHAEPARPWTLGQLASQAASSRSVLAERFAEATGLPTMRYLATWRLELAARLLGDGGVKVGTVARRVGYSSEAAFSRAFKRQTGLSPADWRAGRRSTDDVANCLSPAAGRAPRGAQSNSRHRVPLRH
ncbi:AraC family transcriptional regulator [Albidovulum aquaemixtae]|uniref:AraC family transcriptional regulator n=1 Tax=Albidovulum aquaemixtae TaxID=1542388 RepID=UPI0015E7E6C9|nr:AraC family transcriptional regulator [Defluviimonas aquaemixtae]